MNVNPTALALMKSKLYEKWPSPRICPICGSEDWVIPNNIFFLPEFFSPRQTGEGQQIPVIVATCKVCGYFHSFNPVFLGIFTEITGIEPSGEG